MLHGEGGVFCAGADLKAAGTAAGNRVAPDGDGPMGPTRMRLAKPVIAAVAGHAVAGGLELALWCDLRVAEEDAVFGVFCRRWGVPLIDGGTVRLPRLIGVEPRDGHDPHRAPRRRPRGAADRARQPRRRRSARAAPAAEALAHELARFPQTCMREDRLSLLEQEGLDEAAAMANELAHGMRSLARGAGRAGAVSRRGGAARVVRLTPGGALTGEAGGGGGGVGAGGVWRGGGRRECLR